MSFLSDIATLAKEGYKPQDVKDILTLSKSQENLSSEAQPTEITPASVTDTEVITESEKPVETSTKEIEQPTSEPDYKALYEAEQEKVKALQIKNNNADVSQNVTVKENDLLEAIKSFC